MVSNNRGRWVIRKDLEGFVEGEPIAALDGEYGVHPGMCTVNQAIEQLLRSGEVTRESGDELIVERNGVETGRIVIRIRR